MSFVKLDCGVLDSSLWLEPSDVVKVFITMLAMCDSEGLCAATAPGIARRAVLPLATVRRAMRRLESPDPDDRSGVEEGRRIRRVPGGYLVVNYLAYRQKDHGAAERKRRQRERERESRGMSHESRGTSRAVTQGEGEAEAEGEADREGRALVREKPDDSPPSRINPTTDPTTAKEWWHEQMAARLLKEAGALAVECGWSVERLIRAASTIEASNGHQEKSFSDPRAKGISDEWLETTLTKGLPELRAQLLRPLPL